MKYSPQDNIPNDSNMYHSTKLGERPDIRHTIGKVLIALAVLITQCFYQPAFADSAKKDEGITDFSFAELMHLQSTNISYQEKFAVSCVIFTIHRNWFTVRITIYSTYKVDRCDPATFLNITAASAHAQLATLGKIDFVQMAGPHIQMMDRNETPVQNPFIYVGTIKYTPIAKAKLGLIDLITHYKQNKNWFGQLSFYTPLPTVGDVGFTWFPGSTLYKIVTDDGRVFVMTNMSATRRYKSAEDVDNAAQSLGKFLSLPPGWRYETQVTKNILSIKRSAYSQTYTHYMQDEFGNIYMEITE